MGFSVAGKTVLITGAAMGMGRLFARLAAADHARAVVLWDIDADALDRTAQELRDTGCTVNAQVVDVDSVRAAAAEVLGAYGRPDVLINNAGVVRGKYFWEHDHESDTKFVMDVNTLAPMYVTNEFLPSMIEDRGRECRILNIASAAGTVATPRMAVYAASKWAALGWSDSLRLELVQAGHGHVKVTTVCPSYISTGMFDGVKSPLFAPILSPDVVTARSWRAMTRGKPLLILPRSLYLSRVAKAVLLVRAWDRLADRLGVYRSMEAHTGRVQASTP
ncbi:SDR family NAD(P)-dependent oxidoreductase [Rhodococcus sp. NPDC056960]|uniref:SDR family NAD(P)-dependent oxidoreductase n=1 Tax=Rhodococcus sp. NPDC056960 TaxID=3345982 RepID=UPI00363FF0CB